MAPGGGDIGFSNAGTASSNHCVNSAISQPIVVARLVVDGLCLFFTIILTWLWFRARRRSPGIKELLSWPYGLLLALTLIYLVFGILVSILGSCFIITPLGAASLSVPASVASEVANILLLAIVLVPLTRRLLFHAGFSRRIPTIINVTLLALVATVFVPSIVLSSMASIYRFNFGLDGSTRALITSLGVKMSVAFYLLYFMAAIIGCAITGFALLHAAKNSAYPIEAKIWIPCMMTTLILGSGSVVVEMCGWALPARRLPEGAWIAFLATFNVCFIATTFAALESARAIAVPMINPKDSATYDPDAPEETQPALHRRFTYTGGAELQIPQYAHTTENASWPLPVSPKWPLGSPVRSSFGLGNPPPSPRGAVQHAF